MKLCKNCGVLKNPLEFYKRILSSGNTGIRSNCKKCCGVKNLQNARKKGQKPRSKMPIEIAKQRKLEIYKRHNAKPQRKAKQSSYEAKRRANKLQATPKWLTASQLEHIACYYEVAKCLSIAFGIQMDVDHIIPLKGKNVKGLHVPWNLQVLAHAANRTKSNKVI